MTIKNPVEDDGSVESGLTSREHSKFTKKRAFVFCFIFLLFLAFIAVAVFYAKYGVMKEKTAGVSNVTPVASMPLATDVFDSGMDGFKDCKVLYENCKKEDGCALSSYCGQGENRVCEIYDCDSTYGIRVHGDGIAMAAYTVNKTDAGAAQEKNCTWNMDVFEHNCIDGKMEMKVKVSTAGQCKVSGFDIAYDGKESQPNTFSRINDFTYAVELDKCDNITEISPRFE